MNQKLVIFGIGLLLLGLATELIIERFAESNTPATFYQASLESGD